MYIGSSKDMYDRYSRYHRPSSAFDSFQGYHYPLFKDFREYGYHNFTFHVIHIADNTDSNYLKRLEQYYLNSCKPSYNQHANTNSGKVVILQNVNNNETLHFTSVTDAAKYLRSNKATIRRCYKLNKMVKDYRILFYNGDIYQKYN